MATPVGDSYWVASGGVIAAGRNIFFSSGAEAGSYNAGTQVWTPGRDSNGVVTRASWALVPTDGTWVEVAGTAFTTQVQPLLTAALPTYNDPGASDLADVLDDYSGFAHDVLGGRIFANGGGHQGSANNGLYRCDLKKLSWAIAKLPDMQTYWPANYKTNPPRDNSYSVYTNAKDAITTNPTTTTFGHDEFYDPIEPLANTRNPTARHTYNALTFYGGKLRHGVRRYWVWDETTGAWSSAYPFNLNATTHEQAGGGSTGELVKGTFDEVNNRYLCGPSWISSNPGGIWSKNSDGSWSWPSGFIGGWELYVAAACRMGRKWAFFARPASNNSDYWPPKLRVTDLDTDTLSTINLGGIVQSRCIDSSKYDESTSMEYVGANGKIFCLMPYDANDAYADTAHLPLEAFWIDPVSGTMTLETQTGKFPSLWSYSLLKNKLFYIPQIKSLAIFPSSGENMRIRRFL